MAFEKKEWSDRVSQFPNRFTLTDSDGSERTVTLERSNGEVTNPGDPFNGATMNDLEYRIDGAFSVLGDQVTFQLDGTTLHITTKE